jgi:hypothetical protein
VPADRLDNWCVQQALVPSRGRHGFQNLLNFQLPNSSHLRQIALAVETESYIFLRKRIGTPSPATHIKLVAITLIALRHFSDLPSHLRLPSSFTAQ